MMSEIQLLPAGQLLRRVAIEDGWFADQDGNRVMGWGKDVGGQVRALEWFAEASHNGMLGIYSDSAPLGWLAVHEDGERAAKMEVFVAPERRRQGVGTEAVKLTLKKLFGRNRKQGLLRISLRVMSDNFPAIKFFTKPPLGFRSEGKLWSSTIVDGEPRDEVILAITRGLYRKHKKEVSKC